jgi:hypothetical protein
MKYYSTIILLFTFSIFSIISVLYLANITRIIEKENSVLKKNIKKIEYEININEIEYALYNSYDYLKQMQKIYFENVGNDTHKLRISFNDFKNQNLENFHTVGIK